MSQHLDTLSWFRAKQSFILLLTAAFLVFSGVSVIRSLALCVCFVCRSLFVLLYFFFFLVIVLSVLLRYTDSDYPFGIFKLFLLKIEIKYVRIPYFHKLQFYIFYLYKPIHLPVWIDNPWLSIIDLQNIILSLSGNKYKYFFFKLKFYPNAIWMLRLLTNSIYQ